MSKRGKVVLAAILLLVLGIAVLVFSGTWASSLKDGRARVTVETAPSPESVFED